MLSHLKRLYFFIGIHTAPPGTFFYMINKLLVRQFSRKKRPSTYSRDDKGKFVLAVKITGGIGDHIIAARYLRDLINTVGYFTFDIFSSKPEIAKWVFSNFEGYRNSYNEVLAWNDCYRDYPLAVWVTQFVVFCVSEADWRIVHKHKYAMTKILEVAELSRKGIEPFIFHHPRFDGCLGNLITYKGLNRHNFIHAMSGIAYAGDRLEVRKDTNALLKFQLQDRPYITIHNGFDTDFHVLNNKKLETSTKVYPHFDRVVELLKLQYPNMGIVQLGVRTSQVVTSTDLNLIGKTSMPETAMILQNALLHIDNEGGLVHLATALGTKCCVLFGPTPVEYFGYATNINIKPNFCGGCWWITSDWMQTCPRGFGKPDCLHSITPEGVVDAIGQSIQLKNAAPSSTAIIHTA